MSNLHFSNCPTVTKKLVGKLQVAENIRLSVKTDISQVLSVGTDSFVNSYEASQGEASFYGKTNVKFLYHDGTTPLGANYSADFTASVQHPLLTTESKLCFDVVTVDTKVDTSANTATITLLLEITVWGYVNQSVTYLSGGEDAFTKGENVQVMTSADVVNVPFVIESQLTTTQDITSVLVAESALCVTDYSLHDGILRASGNGLVRLSYTNQGSIVTDTLPFDFSQELDGEQIAKDSQISLCAYVKATKIRLNIAEGQLNNSFTAEIVGVAQVQATQIEMVNVVTDAYATQCDYLLERKGVCTTLPCGSAVDKQTLTINLPLEQDVLPIAVLNVGAIVTNCVSLQGKAVVDGVVQATVLYASDVGLSSQQLELPFSQSVQVDYISTQCSSNAKVTVTSFDVQQGGILVAQVGLCICVESHREVTFNVVVGAEQVDFDKEKLPAIQVCLAQKGETLWQLAKGLHLSQEDLLATNPELTNPLEKDTKVVVFNKI